MEYLTYPPEHDEALSALLDPVSIAQVLALGLNLTNKRVLEVGAGAGTFAEWLLTQVGDRGLVFAVDTNPRITFQYKQLVVHQADLRSDDLPSHFDFIHGRLTLAHIPQREDILRRLALALAPGGVLLVEDWYSKDTQMVMAAPRDEDADLYNRYQDAVAVLFEAGGTDRGWARRVHGQMLRAGLTNVQTQINAPVWHGGGSGCTLMQSVLRQLRPRLLDSSTLTASDLDQIHTLLGQENLVLAGHPLVSTSGARTA